MFLDDVAELIAAEVSHIGLANGPASGDEFSSGGYAHLVPTYGAAAAGEADITVPLEFDGPANTEVTHLVYKRAGAFWVSRAVDTAESFNSDGRINVTSAKVGPATFPA
ncbi:MAG: hypothetical protein LC667_17180 [Thioalkalivibrio sp.]|nr:hypothetical protein [Thioalkalivibrio sp.]